METTKRSSSFFRKLTKKKGAVVAGNSGLLAKADEDKASLSTSVSTDESCSTRFYQDEAPVLIKSCLKKKSSSSSCSSKAKSSKSVLFTSVQIREYERVAGDNPSVSMGVPISIGWDYRYYDPTQHDDDDDDDDDDENETVPQLPYDNRIPCHVDIDVYEQKRAETPPKLRSDLMMSSFDRSFTLRKEWEICETLIRQATKEADKIRSRFIAKQLKFRKRMLAQAKRNKRRALKIQALQKKKKASAQTVAKAIREDLKQ